MNVRFDHLSLNAKNPERMKDFLMDLLGLRLGVRPNLTFDGYFLYAGDKDVIHIFSQYAKDDSSIEKAFNIEEKNIVHHVSFFSDDYEETIKRIEHLNLNYSLSSVPDTQIKQVFVRAPENLMIEIQIVPGES